jgi:hypothetical protein
MFTSNWSGKGLFNNITGSTSEVKEYTFLRGDDNLGKGNNFIIHADLAVKTGGKWEFREIDAL